MDKVLKLEIDQQTEPVTSADIACQSKHQETSSTGIMTDQHIGNNEYAAMDPQKTNIY